MTNIQIERLVEDIENSLAKGKIALDDKELSYPYVAGYYESVLKTVYFMLKQELK